MENEDDDDALDFSRLWHAENEDEKVQAYVKGGADELGVDLEDDSAIPGGYMEYEVEFGEDDEPIWAATNTGISNASDKGLTSEALRISKEDEEDRDFVDRLRLCSLQDKDRVLVDSVMTIEKLCKAVCYLDPVKPIPTPSDDELLETADALILNLGRIGLVLTFYGYDFDELQAAEDQDPNNAKRPPLSEAVINMIMTVEALVSAFTEEHEEWLHKSPRAMLRSGGYLFYGGASTDVIIDMMLMHLRLIIGLDQELLDRLDTWLDTFIAKHCPRDIHLYKVNFNISAILDAHRTKNKEPFAHYYERLMAVSIAAGYQPRHLLGPLETGSRIAAGLAHYRRGPPDAEAPRLKRLGYIMRTEYLATHMVLSRYGIRVTSDFVRHLEIGVDGKMLVDKQTLEEINGALAYAEAVARAKAQRDTLNRKRAKEGLPKLPPGSIRVRAPTVITTTPHRLLTDTWGRLVAWSTTTSLQFGEAQYLKDKMFWTSLPQYGQHAEDTLQPMRIPNDIVTSQHHASQMDHLSCMFLCSLSATQVLRSLLCFRKLGQANYLKFSAQMRLAFEQRATRVKPKVVERPEDFSKREIYDVPVKVTPLPTEIEATEEMKQAGVTQEMAYFMAMAPEHFVPDCTLHRRICIMIALCYLASFFQSANVLDFLSGKLINNPLDKNVLALACHIVKLGTELCFVSTSESLIRVPDQDPVIWFYLYLETLLGWNNEIVRKAANSFRKQLNDFVPLV